MLRQINVYRGRTVTVPVTLAHVISEDDVFTSDIRVDRHFESELIASWTVVYSNPREITLMLDDAVTALVEVDEGFMDIKQLKDGEPIPVFDEPLKVVFKNPVTE